MNRAWHIVWGISLSVILSAALVLLAYVVIDATNTAWLCAHGWKAC